MAFQHKEGDRVPVYEQAITSDVVSEIMGRQVYAQGTSLHYEEAKAWMNGKDAHKEFEEKVWEDTIAINKYFGFDAIDLPWRLEEKPTGQLDEYTFLYGDRNKKWWNIYRFDPASLCYGIIDSWESHIEPQDLVEAVEELEKEFSNRPDLTKKKFSEKKRLLEMFGEELAVLTNPGIAIPYVPVWFEATILYPEVVGRYIDIQVAGILAEISIFAKMGIKVIWAGGDMAGKNGPFYSPKTFRDLVLPGLKKITSLCEKLGVYFLFRSDGNLWPVAKELFVESGIHGYGEIEGDAGMDLVRLKKEYGHLTFWGNVSCDILRRGTKAEVINETKRCIDAASKGGGYIFGTGNSVLSGTPQGNVITMYETAREYGKY
ncbi:MAG: uroporphyrinogen decarboxylase family protein [Bacteroidota bacterium]|nr:uroporphyrinogen decarboxylase family protein [Bacteroidota bacterium]